MRDKKFQIIRGFIIMNKANEDIMIRLYSKSEDREDDDSSLELNIKKDTFSEKIFLNRFKLKDATDFSLVIVKKTGNKKTINVAEENDSEELDVDGKKLSRDQIIVADDDEEIDITAGYEITYHPDGNVAMITISKDPADTDKWIFNCDTRSYRSVGFINNAGMNAKIEIQTPLEVSAEKGQEFGPFCATNNIAVAHVTVCDLKPLELMDMTICHAKVIVSGGRDVESEPFLYSDKSEHTKSYRLTGTTCSPNFGPCD
ncbi:MAG: hypothetical protein ACRCSG_07395 [Cellulosilyticaceae bacterium]